MLFRSDVEVGNKGVVPDREYTFITNSYVISHFKRFFGLEKEDVTIEYTGFLDRDLFTKAVEEQGIIDGEMKNCVTDIAK